MFFGLVCALHRSTIGLFMPKCDRKSMIRWRLESPVSKHFLSFPRVSVSTLGRSPMSEHLGKKGGQVLQCANMTSFPCLMKDEFCNLFS